MRHGEVDRRLYPRFVRWFTGVSRCSPPIVSRGRRIGRSPSIPALSACASRGRHDIDGVTLRGWYLPTEKRRHLIVLVHGMWSSWLEMAGSAGPPRRGFDVLLFDLRGHGQSDPSRLYMGRRERADIRAVMSWAEDQGFSDDRIGWLGYSMGGSTILMEAARNPRDSVSRDRQPYGDLPKLLDTQLSKHSGLPGWFNPGILLAARFVYGVRTDDLMPIRFARAWGPRPLLLIHGESDTTVPVSQAHELATPSASSCLTMTVPGWTMCRLPERPEDYVGTVGRSSTNTSVLSGPISEPAGSAAGSQTVHRHGRPGQASQGDRSAGRRSCQSRQPSHSMVVVTRRIVAPRSGTDAAVGPEGRHVRGLVEQPEPLPFVAGLAEVFRVDEQLFDSPGLVGRIVRQGDRRTSLEDREGCDRDRQGRAQFPHVGLLPSC